MKICNLVCFLSIITLFSCEKDEINPYFAEVYPQILDSFKIECNPDTSYNHIFAQINNMDFCQYESKVGKFNLSKSSKFSTSSPTINTSNTESDARQGVTLELGDSELGNRHDVMKIEFPDFKKGGNYIDYLDSIFSIEEHDIMGSENIVFPEELSLEELTFLKFSGGYLNDFSVQFSAIDRSNINESSGNVFSLKSIFGEQEGSYLRFANVKKSIDNEHVYYDIEIDFSCDLYHWSRYGYEGIWGELRNGKIITKISIDK